jgi:hypothetical protein
VTERGDEYESLEMAIQGYKGWKESILKKINHAENNFLILAGRGH